MSYGSEMSLPEFLDLINTRLTYACAIPNRLPMAAVQSFIETEALQTFYDSYQYAMSKMYYFLDKDVFKQDEYTRYSYITLPCEIQSISWVYEVRDSSMLGLGINTPNLSVNLGVTNQPYMSSYLTTIGDLGMYKTVLDSFSDMMDQMNKFTVKHHFNRLTHRFNVLTKLDKDLILECYVGVPPENLFTDPLFIRYVTGWAKMALGNMMGHVDMPLPGNVKYNTESLISQGQAEMEKVMEEIKGQSNVAWFVMVKR